MKEEAKPTYQVVFTDEFDLYLDIIQEFYANQGDETLNWWYLKEEEIIDYIENLLSTNPFIGLSVDKGSFKGLRRITYGKSKHLMLNYIIYYAVHENDSFVDVINILPSRTKRKRVTK